MATTWRCERCGIVWPWYTRDDLTNVGCDACHTYGAKVSYAGGKT